MHRAFVIGAFVLTAWPLGMAMAEPPPAADVLGGNVQDAAPPKPKPVLRPAPAKVTPAPKPAAGTAPGGAGAATAAAPKPPAAAAPAKAVAAPAAAPAKVAPVPAPAPVPKVAAPAEAKPAAADAAAGPAAASAAPKAVAATGAVATSGAADEAELKVAAGVRPGSPQDKRPAKKLFGAAKLPANLSARAIGGYAKGCLAGGKALAIDGPDWQAMRLSRNRNWGHPKLIALLERFAKEMREKEKWPGLLIGDLAQPRGGPMTSGHKSHQIGLDADIWFRPLPEKRMSRAERETAEPLLLAKDNGSEVIKENWNEGFVRLVRRAAKYPEVERIFVHPAIKKAFCENAGEDRAWLRKVRPMWLHNYHFHVRMGCTGDSPTCVPQKAIEVEGDGCGKELEDWIKLVSKPKKPAPPRTEPVKPSPPPKPAPQITLKDLPPECTEVIAAADKAVEPEPAVAGAPAVLNPKAAQR